MTLKKLLVLDVNGLLIDTYYYRGPLPQESPDARVGNFYVYKRPFCKEFLEFCLENFIVGIWSSAREYNVNNLVDYVFGEAKDKLAFSWHQSCCTDVGLKSPDNEFKPLFMKDLSKLWRKEKVDLPWNEGDYGPSNTLLVDDTPYKAILNPPNTGIFPRPYSVQDLGDDFLGGALRSYLEGIRDAPHVQIYVENNPFGEPSITPENPLWGHVSEVLLRIRNVSNTVGDKVAEILPESLCVDGFQTSRRRISRQKKRDDYEDPLQPIKDDIKLLKNDQLSLGSTDVDPPTNHGNHSNEVQTRSSLQLEDQQIFEGATEGSTEQGHAGQIEEKETDLSTDEETNCEHHESSEEEGNKIYTPGAKFDENSQLSSSKSKCMEAEDIQEQSHEKESHKKHQWLTRSTDGPERTSNDFKGAHYQLHRSNYRRQKHKMFQREPAAGQNKRSYYGRDNIDDSRHWKRQKRFYQKDNKSGQYRNIKNWPYQDNRRDSLGYDHSSKGERARYPGVIMPSLNGLQHRKEYEDRGQHVINYTGEDFGNRNTPLDLYAHYSRGQSHGNWQIDYPAEYFHGSNRASPNRMIFMNYMGQSCRGEGNVGTMPPNINMFDRDGFAPNINMFDQDGFAPSYQHHEGFNAWTPKDYSPHPNTIEDWSFQGRHPYLGKRDGGGPRGPHRDQGAHSHSYTRGGGAPRPSYRNNGASKQWHQFNSNERKEGGTPWGYNRSRQH